ncbi:MAG: hypothetical protein ACI4DV_09440 [Lachnospiraceae bacterium]
MLNEEKIRYMTKAAAFENSEKKKDLWISGYFRSDYVGFFMLRSGIAYTAAFVILAALRAVSDMENLTILLGDAQILKSYLIRAVIAFAVGLILYEIAAFLFYSARYQRAKNSVGEYKETLKKIRSIYDGETEPVAETERAEGEESYDDFRV